MNFTLDIPERDAIWRPGGTVQGVARLAPGKEGASAEIKAVRIEMSGELHTETAFYYGFIDSGSLHTVVPLFHEELVLFRGPYKVGAAQEWPFTLHIPADCRFAKPQKLSIPENEHSNFDSTLLQPLPPSMHAATESKEGHKYCAIRYHITGKVEMQRAMASDLEFTIDLRVVPARSEADRDRQPKFTKKNIPVSVTSAYLAPGVGSRELTLKEKLRAKMGRSLPSVSFKMLAQLPDAGVMFDPPPIHLEVGPSIEEDEAAVLPQVILKSFSVQLLRNITQITHRTAGPHALHWRHPDPIVIAKWQGSTPIEGVVDLSSLYTYKESDWDQISPNFRTFACRQAWTLSFTATIEVARKEQVITAQQSSFNLLSPFVNEQLGLTMEEASIVADGLPPSYGGNAPAYTA